MTTFLKDFAGALERFQIGLGHNFRTLIGVVALGSLLVAPVAGVAAGRAGDFDTPDGAAKKDGTRAVRLSSVEGAVQVVQDGQTIADPATANLPLFEGTQIITGNDGRAEIEFEDGSVARLSPNSTLTLTVLGQAGAGTKTEIVLNSGLGYFELQPSTAEHSLRVSYGTATFTASSFSVVRVTLDEAPGELSVFSGDVHLERGDTLQLDVHAGETLDLNAQDLTKYDVAEMIPENSWDSWNADRDQLQTSESAGQTAATLGGSGLNQEPGMADLDANGNWYNVPGQGYVWSPYDAQNEGASWDPYGYGSWVSYPGYGYIFTSGYGWGYAPYQCGLWNYYDNFGWGWAPGLGGCNGWYGGYGGWGYNIGNAPRGYKPPRRPFPGPVHPRPIHGASGGTRLAALPVIPVDRRPAGSTTWAANGRGPQPVTIAGHVVQPLAPLHPRATFGGSDRSASSFVNNGGATRPGYYPSSTGRPGPTVQPGYRPYSGSAGRPAQAPASRPSSTYSGGGASRASAPSGGGGGGHVSGGGGSAGGAGTHK